MKALIFAAGLGTRLRPYTDDRPKAMVEVAGKPMLQHVIERVAAAGFDDITINIHHYGQMIIDFLEQHDNFGVNLHISDERGLLLDTGGGILKARPKQAKLQSRLKQLKNHKTLNIQQQEETDEFRASLLHPA